MNKKTNSPKRAATQKQAKTPPLEGYLHAIAKRTGGQVCLTARGVRYFAKMTTARNVRHAAGLSLQGVALRGRVTKVRMGVTIRHQYSTSAIACMEKATEYRRNKNGARRARFPMPAEVIRVYQDALQDAVVQATDGDMRVTFKVFNTGWHVIPQVKCRVCLEWYTPKRGNISRCDWCARHGETKRRKVYDERDRGGVL